MNYSQAIETLYNQAPMFQQQGPKAYKTGMENTYLLDEMFSHPHRKYQTIHVAGTNGKCSSSNLLAAVLQSAGYKVGLYTSPHLVDFRERIRIDGEMIPEEYVCDFVEKVQPVIAKIQPSFFEITTALAFRYFADCEVDVAVVEVGLGGRLDCTNVIKPLVSVITNISIDHTDLLGSTIEEIAYQKAGIIKPGVPVVIGETQQGAEDVFRREAKEQGSEIFFADRLVSDTELPECQLSGVYQQRNMATVMQTIKVLRRDGVLRIDDAAVKNGFANVCRLTGFVGRWQQLGESPKIICDTGHNEAGIRFVVEQLSQQKYDKLRMVVGFVSDKKIDKVLSLLPKNAVYYFTEASIPRALPADKLASQAGGCGLCGGVYKTVREAFDVAKADASSEDLIFVGGSNFIVAEVL